MPPHTSNRERPGIPSGERVCVARTPGERARLEAFVSETYRAAYGARVTHFLPVLLGIEGCGPGGLVGVIGVKPGSAPGPFFLESYLAEPAERAVSRAMGRAVPRTDMAEVGNLSSRARGAGRALISAMCDHLEWVGIAHAVFTGTRALRNCFARLGVRGHDLGPADGRRLGAALADWGTYYEQDPRVTAVFVPAVREAVVADLARRAS
ncbi:MAG: thermostable hemolysin [Planctomycetes bacterium]|jgi:hypothetical protein|nr:thermostable hemolysin [Planctomycetota bacterium]